MKGDFNALQGFLETQGSKYVLKTGDKIVSLILTNFLQEDLLPKHSCSQLRKSLALLDEPEASYQHFAKLISSFATANLSESKHKNRGPK